MAPRNFRSIAAVALLATFAAAQAERGSLSVTAYPSISVADGRSTVTISAELRDSAGRLAPDGSRILFASTLGSFRESIATTVNGIARAVLVAGGTPGTAKITATGISVDVMPATLEFEFVGDRSLLSSATDYVEIVAADYMNYTGDTKIIGAAAPNQGVSIRYHDLEVLADDVQFNTQTMELKARHAKLKYGRWTQDFEQLYLRLTQRKGLGLTTYTTKRYDAIVARGRWFAFVKVDADGHTTLPQDEQRFGTVEVRPGTIRPTNVAVSNNLFEFKDLSEAPSSVSSKKAVVFPRKEVQFQRAEVSVGGTKVIKVPLYAVSLTATNSPLVTEQLVSLNNNRIALNYPHYLTLTPGSTSILRFRAGTSGNGGASSMRGVFVDYELNWNRGDDMEGAFAVKGLARDDWVASLRQYLRIDDHTSASAQIDMPAGQSVYGSANVSREFTGFQANLNASTNRSLRGLPFSREDYSLTVEKDPTKVGKLPLRLYYGLVAQSSRADYTTYGASQQDYGIRLRGQSLPQHVMDKNTSLTTGFSVSKLVGSSVSNGLTFVGTASLARQISNGSSVVATYDYVRDGFNEYMMGRHRLSVQLFSDMGRTHFSTTGSRSLDLDRSSLYADMSYRLSGIWRLAYGYTFDRYLGTTYADANVILGYRIGWREVGLTWSRLTNRIGVQLLGANF